MGNLCLTKRWSGDRNESEQQNCGVKESSTASTSERSARNICGKKKKTENEN